MSSKEQKEIHPYGLVFFSVSLLFYIFVLLTSISKEGRFGIKNGIESSPSHVLFFLAFIILIIELGLYYSRNNKYTEKFSSNKMPLLISAFSIIMGLLVSFIILRNGIAVHPEFYYLITASVLYLILRPLIKKVAAKTEILRNPSFYFMVCSFIVGCILIYLKLTGFIFDNSNSSGLVDDFGKIAIPIGILLVVISLSLSTIFLIPKKVLPSYKFINNSILITPWPSSLFFRKTIELEIDEIKEFRIISAKDQIKVYESYKKNLSQIQESMDLFSSISSIYRKGRPLFLKVIYDTAKTVLLQGDNFTYLISFQEPDNIINEIRKRKKNIKK
ncbi:MAG: hypothetical protein AABX29_03555 [Nanoarchaeota archaeon]